MLTGKTREQVIFIDPVMFADRRDGEFDSGGRGWKGTAYEEENPRPVDRVFEKNMGRL